MKYIIILMSLSMVLSSPEILTSPGSVNVIDGDIAVFYCRAVADILFFFVNGTFANEQVVVAKGFKESTVTDIDETTKERTLTATALTQYNNTTIICSASIVVDLITVGTVLSDPAVLLVQDLFSAGDLSFSYVDSFTVNISWTPPFALPDINVAEYNISVTSNGTTTSFLMSSSYFVLHLNNITDSPCDEVNVTVSRYNNVSGKISLPVITFYPPSAISLGSFSPVITVDLNETNGIMYITISIDISGVCPRDYPKDIDIRVFRFADQILVDFLRNLSVLVSENAIVTLEEAFTLSSNERYSAEIFFQNPNGEFNVTGAVNFSTYAVQSIMINETGAMLEVVCAFAPNTEAIGCEVTIVRLLNKEVFGSMRAYRTGNSAVMRFLNVLDDEYRLDVFEIENNGFLVQVLTELFQPSAQQPTSETINSFSSTTSAVFQMTTSSNLISMSMNSPIETSGSEGNNKGSGNLSIGTLIAVTIVPVLAVLLICALLLVYVMVYKHRIKSFTFLHQSSLDNVDTEELCGDDLSEKPSISKEETETGHRSTSVKSEGEKTTFDAFKNMKSDIVGETVYGTTESDAEKSNDGTDDSSKGDDSPSKPLLHQETKPKSFRVSFFLYTNKEQRIGYSCPDRVYIQEPHLQQLEEEKSVFCPILAQQPVDKNETSQFVLTEKMQHSTSNNHSVPPISDHQSGQTKNQHQSYPVLSNGEKKPESRELTFCRNTNPKQKKPDITMVVPRRKVDYAPSTEDTLSVEEKEQKPLYEVVVPCKRLNVTSAQDSSSIVETSFLNTTSSKVKMEQDQKNAYEGVVPKKGLPVKDTSYTTNSQGKEVVYTSLSDFKDVPKAPPSNNSVTYVDSASLLPSWQPPVPPKRNRMGKTSQRDPFFGK